MKHILINCFLLVYFTVSCVIASKLSPLLQNLAQIDTTCKIWVYFTDKNCGVQSTVSSRGLARRARAGYLPNQSDCPVSTFYISGITAIGGLLQNVYKWENAASFTISTIALRQIEELAFVQYCVPVPVYVRKNRSFKPLEKNTQSDTLYVQTQQNHHAMLAINRAHTYLRKRKNVLTPGDGVFIGIFDSGFRLDHQCFSFLKNNNKIRASRDFVDGDHDPQDSDSLLNHGSVVLAQIAGYDPQKFTGVAWGTDVALARTEISEQEIHTEEDNWVAALVWAESLGVDIVSSSLGYLNTFEDSIFINGEYIVDYPYRYIDGNSTMVSRAAQQAVERGMLIVNAVGNEGSNEFGTLTAPADVEDVIAVGSVSGDKMISSFSGTGPTADGRIKPDCVAPGQQVVVPDFSSSHTPYTILYGGTSFAAPQVSGIVAMIIQANGKPYKSETIREKLYTYCTFIPGQDSIDNIAGRGIPDALMSIMDSTDIFIEVVDSSNVPVAGATVEYLSGELAGFSDRSGVIILNSSQYLQEYVVLVPGDTERVSIQKFPAYKRIVVNSKACITVQVRDTGMKPLSRCMVHFKINDGSGIVTSYMPDDSGNVYFSYGKEVLVGITVAADGYYTPDTSFVRLTQQGQALTLILTKVPTDAFVIYPNVLKRSKNSGIKAFFSYSHYGYPPSMVQALICSVDGTLIWKKSVMSPTSGQPVFFEWNGNTNGRYVAPGIYYFLVKFNGETYRQKFLIAE